MDNLTPYQGSKPSFGVFLCTKCNRLWTSAFSWANKSQTCLQCKSNVYPHTQRPHDNPGELELVIDPSKHHPQELCEMCLEVGMYCRDWFESLQYQEEGVNEGKLWEEEDDNNICSECDDLVCDDDDVICYNDDPMCDDDDLICHDEFGDEFEEDEDLNYEFAQEKCSICKKAALEIEIAEYEKQLMKEMNECQECAECVALQCDRDEESEIEVVDLFNDDEGSDNSSIVDGWNQFADAEKFISETDSVTTYEKKAIVSPENRCNYVHFNATAYDENNDDNEDNDDEEDEDDDDDDNASCIAIEDNSFEKDIDNHNLKNVEEDGKNDCSFDWEANEISEDQCNYKDCACNADDEK